VDSFSPYSIPDKKLFQKAQTVQSRLVKAFGIPEWHQPESPLDELVSTILSQNTNDTNRDKAFTSLKLAFPAWEQVRDAPINEVISAIRIAGLANQKGPRIRNVLKEITQQKGNLDLSFLKNVPGEDAREWLLKFKGVGPKTAAIVMQFTLGHPAFPVDTHIYRVTGRMGLRPEKLSVEKAHQLMEHLFQPEDFGVAHMNLIRLGREICHPRKPECLRCPVNGCCDYFARLPK
jgi:endonuclease III